jgi:hypothetical protein
MIALVAIALLYGGRQHSHQRRILRGIEGVSEAQIYAEQGRNAMDCDGSLGRT